MLSPELKCEVVTQMSARMLASVWFFDGLETNCMVELALRMKRKISSIAPRAVKSARTLRLAGQRA